MPLRSFFLELSCLAPLFDGESAFALQADPLEPFLAFLRR